MYKRRKRPAFGRVTIGNLEKEYSNSQNPLDSVLGTGKVKTELENEKPSDIHTIDKSLQNRIIKEISDCLKHLRPPKPNKKVKGKTSSSKLKIGGALQQL